MARIRHRVIFRRWGRAMIGVDPGMRETGLVLINDAGDVINAMVVERSKTQSEPAYVREVLVAIGEYWSGLAPDARQIAVEGVVAPNPHLGLTNPNSAIRTGVIYGAILGAYPDVITVEPGGNGSSDPYSYPVDIQPPRPGMSGKDWKRHLRSAYDVALRAKKLQRLELV